MEGTTSTSITAENQSMNNNELKSAENIEDCQQQRQRKQRSNGNGRWCTSSARSRSSTSFLIHNLLISCSGGASNVPTTASPTSLPMVEPDNDNGDTSSSNESKSRSCSPQEEQLSSPLMNVKEERKNVNEIYDDNYRIKRRKCSVPFRRRTTNKKDSNRTNISEESDDENIESKNIIITL